jgi:hypothetical protein
MGCYQSMPYPVDVKDGRFSVSVGWVTISNPDLLSSCETGVNSGMRSWKKHLSEWALCQKAIGGICFKEKRKAGTLQSGSECNNFKPRLKTISSIASPSWMDLFWGWWCGFSERGSQDL